MIKYVIKVRANAILSRININDKFDVIPFENNVRERINNGQCHKYRL
jgi:hypothetical protein